MIVQPQPILPNYDDGGLARRQGFREVKERMDAKLVRRGRDASGRQPVMVCAECVSGGSKSPNRYRTWTVLREHLIDYHGIDRREVPE